MRKIDPFAYINQYYGLNIKKHSPVVLISGERGQVVSADGAHIYIQWDGHAKPRGPYHPTHDLTYPIMPPKGE